MSRKARLPKATKRRNKPFVEMDRHEFEATFDELGMQNNFETLQAARRGDPDPFSIAVATLRGPSLPADGVAAFRSSMEYGDDDGTRFIDEWIAEIQRVGLLLPGETLTRTLLRVTATEEIKGA